MKVICKRRNICSFKNLDPGDVFKISETGSLFMKIANQYRESLNCLNIETGKLYEVNSIDEVTKVNGYFIEEGGMVEHDS